MTFPCGSVVKVCNPEDIANLIGATVPVPVSFDGALDVTVAEVAPVDLTLLTSATRSGTTNTADQTNENPYRRGVILYLNVTELQTLNTIQVSLQGKDPVSGGYFTLKQSTSISAVGLVGLTLGSGDVFGLPRVWRVQVAHAGLNAPTYSLGASLIP